MKFPIPDPSLRAVTFDLDGLMFNTEELYQEVGGEILARRGCQITGELLDQMMGRKSNIALQVMIDWHKLDATPAQLAAESADIFAELLPHRLQPMRGLLDLLAALEAAGIPKGVATSSGRDFVWRVLDQFNLRPRMAFVLTGEDIEHGKPAPDVYLLAASRHGVAPPEMLVLEDSHIGCQAAVASGAYAVAVPHGRSTSHEFPGVQFIAESLADGRIYGALGLDKPASRC
jgi:HAD superfamily hydrolase (TIGR01509 family)